MQYDEFVGQVQNRAHLPSQGEAVAAIRATLETLAERLTKGESDHLSAQLPREIAAYLRPATLLGQESLTLDQFFARVSDREGVDLPKSVHHARVVAEVLREAVSPGEFDDMLAQLPDEYNQLFQGSTGKIETKKRAQKVKS
jgi:uncharacterized protein (DUF2267 family)